MATRILGVDLGAYSVKVLVATSGFRGVVLSEYIERPVPPGEGTYEERAMSLLAAVVRERGLSHDVPYTVLPGDRVSMRVLDFPFHGLRRSDLEKAVGAELEAQIPLDLDEFVFDFEPLRLDVEMAQTIYQEASPSGDEKDKPQKGTPSGTKVLAAAAARKRVELLLKTAQSRGLEQPRSILAAPTVYGRVVEKIPSLADVRHEGVMVVDLGHTHTDLCVVKHGRTVFARTLSRGGKNVTQAIAKAWNLPFADAERAKHSDGFIASGAEPPPSAAWGRISEVTTREMQPLVRELRQTLSACRAQTGVVPRRVLLCGGGSRLRGLASFLTEHIDVPVVTLSPDDALVLGGPGSTETVPADVALLAYGIVLEGATGRPLYDLRQDDLAYKADFSFLRARAGYLAAALLVLIAFAAGNAYAALYKLRKEEAVLAEDLERETRALFGASVTAEEVREKLAPKKEKSPLPKLTAFDQLVEMSKVIPDGSQLKLDVKELDIRPGKVTIEKATTDSSKAIDDLVAKLQEGIGCFTEIQRGREVGAEEKQFSLTIATKCM